jgi:cytidine deaminase
MIELTDDERRALIDLANEAGRRAYAPYSNYPVGAVVRTRSGRIFTGCNVENAAYPTSMCAERIAIYKAISEGEKEFDVIAVATPNGGTPCGGCRQVMAEFGLDTVVLVANCEGHLVLETTVAGLLPGAFTPKDLKR